jgi:hypothetical protein
MIIHSAEFLEKQKASRNSTHAVCKRCKEDKPITDFCIDRFGKRANLHYPICKQCKAEEHRKRYAEDPSKFRQNTKRWGLKNPEAVIAHRRVQWAIQSGKLVRPDKCELCGCEKRTIHAHHKNGYEQEHWLDVMWICQQCHNRLRINADPFNISIEGVATGVQ